MAGESDISPTWGTQLARAERILAEAGVPAPHQEAAELLGYVLGVPVSTLMARPTVPMLPSNARTYAVWVARRVGGVPIPYITGHLDFMGLDITIGWESPLPAPGTSRLVEAALQWARHCEAAEFIAADIGTGCGAVALALATLEPRFTHVYAMDTSPEALLVARVNGARYLMNLVIEWIEGDELDVIPEPVDLIICGQFGTRPPIVGDQTDTTAARSGVSRASERCARMLTQAPAKLRPDGALICIVAEEQRSVVTGLVQEWSAAPVWADMPESGLAIVVAERPRNVERDV